MGLSFRTKADTSLSFDTSVSFILRTKIELTSLSPRTKIELTPACPQLPLGLFGRHVRRRPKRHSAFGIGSKSVGQLGQAEVGDPRLIVAERRLLNVVDIFCVPALLEQHVTRLEVAMEHAALMRMLNGPGQRRDHPSRIIGRHRPRLPRQPLRQRGTSHISRGDIGDRANCAVFINRDDVRMIEPGRSVRFALKPLACLGRDQGLGLRHLERHRTAQGRVPREENDAEASLAQDTDNLEPAEVLAWVAGRRLTR